MKMTKTGLRTWRLPVGLALATGLVAAGCQNSSPPGCRIAQQSDLVKTELTQLPDLRLDRIGDDFALLGLDKEQIRWAKLRADGLLGTESVLKLPGRLASLGPWFALVGKNAPGDQLVAVYAVPKAGATDQVEIDAVTQDTGAAVSAPKRLFDLPAGADIKAFRMTMASSRSGMHAVIAWGFAKQTGGLQSQIVRADASMPNSAQALMVMAPWDCLAMAPGKSDLTVSLLEGGDSSPTWRATEFKVDGSIGLSLRLVLNSKQAGCPTVSPTAKGYGVAWQTEDGTFFTEYDLEANAASPKLVVGAVYFGGAQAQPRVACVASMAKDFTLTFDRPAGPQVWRINIFGSVHGDKLMLPSAEGKVGPVAAWPVTNAFYATYLDQVRTPPSGSADAGGDAGNSTGNLRRLIKVDCPLEFSN